MKGEVRRMTDTDREKEYGEMTAEELEQRLRETFFYPDRIDQWWL